MRNDLARIDREWLSERDRHLVTDRFGSPVVPTRRMAIRRALSGLAPGIALAWIPWLEKAGNAPALVAVGGPVAGALCALAGLGWGIRTDARARAYDTAWRLHLERRAEVTRALLR